MAIPKRARVTHTEKWNDFTCHIRCEMLSPAELGFTGGQYVIINSGIQLPNGHVGKRAYSIAASDTEQKQFDLMVRQIPGGVGSRFIHELKPGQVFEFSGPWGKYLPPPDGEQGKILIVATDTGLTAALGLTRGRGFVSFLRDTQLVWFLESDSYFIPLDFVREWIPIQTPPVGDPARILFCRNKIEEIVEGRRFNRIYLSGDGQVLSELKKFLMNRGYGEDQILVETFFNHVELKAPSFQERRS